jgi:Protein of unknown function (DUF4236)/Bacterial Ig-like domain
VSANLSKSGPSLSVGVRGAHVTVGRTGVRRTVGLPGSGSFALVASGTVATLVPAASLGAATPYQLTVTNTIEARAGNHLDFFASQFTTAP